MEAGHRQSSGCGFYATDATGMAALSACHRSATRQPGRGSKALTAEANRARQGPYWQAV